MASEVRSGSTFIAEAVAYSLERDFGFKFFQLAEERLNFITQESSQSEVLTTLESLYLDSSGFACTKIMCAALSLICDRTRFSKHLSDLVFGTKTIWLIVRRRKKIRQAVSLAYSRQSGVYHYYDKINPSEDEYISVSNHDINIALGAIIRSDLILETFSAKLLPTQRIEIFYEDFIDHPEYFLKKIYDACGFDNKLLEGHSTLPSKLIPTAQKGKSLAEAEFTEWFLRSYI